MRRRKNVPTPRQFIKWVGGKSRIVEAIVRLRPPTFGVYHEPFLGSGAVFFALCRYGLIRHAVLSDINWELVETYRALRQYPETIMRLLDQYPNTKDFFYAMVEQDPRQLSPEELAARFIYINKTTRYGLYRLNSRGKFCGGYGYTGRTRYYDRENILAVSNALSKAELLCVSYDTVNERASAGDWMYFDPPYLREAGDSDFNGLYGNYLNYDDHVRLRDVYASLTEKNVSVSLSHTDIPAIRELYRPTAAKFNNIYYHRTFTPHNHNRRFEREVFITNYTPVGEDGFGNYMLPYL